MANAFLPGQKLTAADLNAAIESIAGPYNPTSDSKWNQTKYGKLFKSWDAFRNSQNQTPQPLDVGIEFQIFPNGQTVNGLDGAKLRGQRQIFLNLGIPQTYQAGPIGIEEHALPIGKMNDCPFVGVLGYQYWSSNALVPGDDKLHFSLWGRWGLEPGGQDAANWELWKQRQKLYDVDTSRPFSPLHWWYTGISPERSAAISDWTLNIVATAAYIVCKKKATVESDSHKYFRYPLLVVATQFDAILYPALSSPALNASVLQQVQACYGPALDIDVAAVEFDPTANWITIATYNVAEKLQDASYKQQTNFAQFYSDHGAYSIKSAFGENSILLNKPQFIDSCGKHRELFDYAFVGTTDMEGEDIDPTRNVTMALVMCYDYGPQQASLSCISCDFTDQSLANPDGDSVSALLAPFYEEHDEARLVWVKQPGAVGIQYFDRCPDFRKAHVDSSLSTLQEHGLSSIQEKDMTYIGEADGQQRQLSAKVYNLFDFDDSENVRNYNNGVDDPNLIDLVTRNREDENGDMFVEYMSLSSVLSSVGATIMSCDTEKTDNYKSLDTVLSGDGAPYYQMHGFKLPEEVGCTTIVRFDDVDYSGNADWSFAGNEQFVVRVPDGCGGYEINYKKFSIMQEHERVDSDAPSTRGRSTQYSSYINDIGGCYQVLELYNFDIGCTMSLTPQQVSADSGNGILVRKNQGNAYNLEYMDFDSLDNFAKRYVGDSQLNPSTHAPTDNSISISWDTDDEVFMAELWRFRNGGQAANVEIRTDGCTYYWPQNSKSASAGDDYILVKHVDGNGNAELQYKQLVVTMPDIDMAYYDNIISQHTSDITYLSGVIDDLSGSLSGDYWESGGDSSTCYGESIGNSEQDTVIDLDSQTLYGHWRIDIIDSYSISADFAYFGQMQARDAATAGCGFYTGCTYVCPTASYFDGTLTVEGCGIFNSNINIGAGGCLYIGSTSLSEQQLQALLRLI